MHRTRFIYYKGIVFMTSRSTEKVIETQPALLALAKERWSGREKKAHSLLDEKSRKLKLQLKL